MEMNIKLFSFALPKQQQALRLLNLVQNPEQIDHPKVRQGFDSFKNRRGGFGYQLEQFCYRHHLLNKENPDAIKDAQAMITTCCVVDCTKKDPAQAFLLIDMNAADMLSPGFSSRFNKDQNGHDIIEVIDHTPAKPAAKVSPAA